MPDLTQLLNAVQGGQSEALDQILPLVYEELRRLASKKLVHEQPGQTLQPTALVHEAYLRLIGPANADGFANRRHFFAAAAEAMRRILVDQARNKQAVRHGGDAQRQHPDLDQLPQAEQSNEILSVHEALGHLAAHDPLKAELVKLRYFAGFTNDEAAELLGISSKSAEKQWVYARAWLKHKLSA
jgi:RNA polymerase sigma factor (TIGR02999 family)